MTFTDPKTGRVLWTAKVGAIVATSGVEASAVTGVMHEVDGRLYQDGQPADEMLAPMVTVDNEKHVIAATGGVHVKSLTQADTTVTCDDATWYANDNKLIGRGNVVFRKGGFTQSGSSFAADTRLHSVVMPAPGLGRHPVTAHLKF